MVSTTSFPWIRDVMTMQSNTQAVAAQAGRCNFYVVVKLGFSAHIIDIKRWDVFLSVHSLYR